MKAGDITMIYANPLTQENPEGKARLVKCLIADPGIKNFKYWDIEFIEEPGTIYQRWVYPS